MVRKQVIMLGFILAASSLFAACDAEILFRTDLRRKTEPIGDDTDGDGISDRDEIANGLDRMTPDSSEDPDGDGLTNVWEVKLGYDPHNADSGNAAGNGINDCEEDKDGDGAKNCWEIANGFDPGNAADWTLDADEDGFSNSEEGVAGTEPKVKENHPGPSPLFTVADNDLDVAGYTNNTLYRVTMAYCNEGDQVYVSSSADKPTDLSLFVDCTLAANGLTGKLGTENQGEHTIYVWRKNAGGVVDSPLTGTITYDVTGPKGDLAVVSEEVGESVVTITLPKAPDYASQILRRIQSSDCSENRPEDGTGFTVAKDTTTVADSGFEASVPQCYRIFWYDVLGNEAGLGVVLSPPPAPTFVSLAFANGASDAYVNAAEHAASTEMPGTLTATDYDTADYKLVAKATTCDQNLTYGAKPKTDSADFTADGEYKICVKLVGTGGSMTFGESETLTLDTSLPAFTSLALLNEALDGTINAVDHALTNDLAGTLVASGHDTAAYRVVTAATTCDAALTYGAMPKDDSSQFGASGNYKVCVKLSDAAGNPAAYGNTGNFAYDVTPPTFTSLPLANQATGGYINDAEKAVAADVAGPVSGADYTSDQYVVVASTTTCDGALTYGAMPQNPAVTPDGTYKVCARLADAAGNVTYGSSSNVERDTTVPSFTSVALANEAVDTYINIADHLLTNDLVSAAVGTGHTVTEYKLVTSATTCDVNLTYGALPKNDSPDFVAETTYKVCVKLTDAAGNTPAYGNSSNITYDNTAPTFTSLAFANDAVGGYVNAAERAVANDMAGALVGAGYTTDTYKLVASTTTCDGALTYAANPKNTSADFTSDGNYKICARLADAAGNTAFGSTTTLVLDTSLPDFTSLALINEAADQELTGAEHGTTNAVAGSLVATGYTTAAYVLVTSATTCDVALTYGAMPTNDSGVISADGAYKVCAKLTDAAGNPADYGSTLVFTYDSDGQIACTRSVGHNYYYEGTAVTLTYDCDTLVTAVTNPDGEKPAWLTRTSAVNGTSTQVTFTGTAPAVGATVTANWDWQVNGDTTVYTPNTSNEVVTGVLDSSTLAASLTPPTAFDTGVTGTSHNYAINAGAEYDFGLGLNLNAAWDGVIGDVSLTANTITSDLHGLTALDDCASVSAPYVCNDTTAGTLPAVAGALDLKWRWSAFDQGTYFVDIDPTLTIEGVTKNLTDLGAGTGNLTFTIPLQANGNASLNDRGDPSSYTNLDLSYGIAISSASTATAPQVGLVYAANDGFQSAFFRKVTVDRTHSSADATPTNAITQPAADADQIMHDANNQSWFNVRPLSGGEWALAGVVVNSGNQVYFSRLNAAGTSRTVSEFLTASADSVTSSDLSEAFLDADGSTTRMAVAYSKDPATGNDHVIVGKVNPYAVGSVSDDPDYVASGQAYDYTAGGASVVDRVRTRYHVEDGVGYIYVAHRENTDLKVHRIEAATANTADYGATTVVLASDMTNAGVTNVQSLDFAVGTKGTDSIVGAVYRSNTAGNDCYFLSASVNESTGAFGTPSTALILSASGGICVNPTVHFNPKSGRFVVTYSDNGSGSYVIYTTEVDVSGASPAVASGFPIAVTGALAAFPRRLVTQYYDAGDWMAVFYRVNATSVLKLHGYHVPRR